MSIRWGWAVIGSVLGVFLLGTTTAVRAQDTSLDSEPLSGTIWMKVMQAGTSKDDPYGTEHIPDANLPRSIVRYAPQGGPQLRGLACYSVDYDPTGDEICFMRGRDSDTEGNQNVFYLARGDGSNVQLLKRQSAKTEKGNRQDFTPCFMPDGRILFEASERIAVMNRDGSNVQFLTGEKERCGQPTISADGQTIAFENNGICLMDVTGTHRRKLVTFPTYYGTQSSDYSSVTLSPDGTQVAYTRRTGRVQQIYVLSTDAPASKSHPSYRVTSRDPHFHLAEYCDPVWSPDGKFLAIAGGTEETHDIYLVEIATGKMRQLIATETDEYPDTWH